MRPLNKYDNAATHMSYPVSGLGSPFSGLRTAPLINVTATWAVAILDLELELVLLLLPRPAPNDNNK